MQTGHRLGVMAPLIIAIVLFLAGCASMAERGLLPDVKARRPPDLLLGEEILLLKGVKFADAAHFASLIGTDGRAHLFAADKDGQVHHVEVSERAIVQHEILGAATGAASNRAIDAVEHPAGRLRVLAGDRQFFRSAPGGKWEEVRGNRCSKFVPADNELFCAFIADGRELGAPERRDWTVGWFILLPIVFWSDVTAEKLVLAQETPKGWAIRAVLDPETKLSAWSDFAVGTDGDGSMHFLYRSSGGGSSFIVAFGAGGGGAWGSGPVPEIRYARVRYAPLLSASPSGGNAAAGPDQTSVPWVSIEGQPLASLPYSRGRIQSPTFLRLFGPLDRSFAVNAATGDLSGLAWIYNLGLDDGIRRMEISEVFWVHVTLKEGQWAPHFEILAAGDLPEPGWRWFNDRGALIRIGPQKGRHALITKAEPGFWSSRFHLCYLYGTGSDWSAPLVLGNDPAMDCRRSLAMDSTGKVFAVWEDRDHRLIGRWILPKH